MHKILPFKIAQYHHQDELNLLLNTAKQLIYHYFAVEQQLLLSLPDKVSQVSPTAFLSNLNGAQQNAQFFLFVILALILIFHSFMTLYLTHYQTQYLSFST